MKIKIINIPEKLAFILAFIALLLSGCELEENPTDKLSKASFWKTEKDAELALVGLYETWGTYGTRYNPTGWSTGYIYLSHYTDNARGKGTSDGNIGVDYYVGCKMTNFWRFNYQRISRCNNFLENIEDIEMDADKKAEMIAEARYARAYCYFILCQYYGDVPLVTKVLTIDEANSVSRDPKEDVVNFVLNELTAAAQDLPVTRPSSEYGRHVKAAALAMKGRLLMAEEMWSEAADAYKEIIELDVYQIDPRFEELFLDDGEINTEIIQADCHLEDVYGWQVSQQSMVPQFYGGWGEQNLFQNFVDAFLMIDGLSIEESPLYDPDHPFDNRDPRLYATVLLPGYTLFRGRIFQGHPDSTTFGIGNSATPGATGYAQRKFLDENYTGNRSSYGGDFPLIRYAEVLLSYLESKLEAGDAITQSLLDETINQVRGRAAVNMPPVTETDPAKLREIIRRERRVELAFEGLRYWDIRRWKIAPEVLNKKFYGMKLTDNPETYTDFTVNEKGHLYSCTKRFDEKYNYVLPIPQSELDVNPNLSQNPGY